MDSFQGFPPVLAIFYSEFHPTQGPKVTFQVPENFVSSTSSAAAAAVAAATTVEANAGNNATTPTARQPSSTTSPSTTPVPALSSSTAPASSTLALLHTLSSPTLGPNPAPYYYTPTASLPPPVVQTQPDTLDFDSISEYIIPKPALSNRLVTISTDKYKILSHPVTIINSKYSRNALLFNLCFVFEKGAMTGVYEQVVRKLARILRALEVQSSFLSQQSVSGSESPATSPDEQHSYPHRAQTTLGNILEQILEDLNSYAECQIPINDSSVVNLKLFPKYPDPPTVHDHLVPVLTVSLAPVLDKHWDMTLRRILPHIDGVHSVRRVADAADVDIQLVRIAVQHLLYYGCVKMVDVFQFSNVYAVKPCITTVLLGNPALQVELQTFVGRRKVEDGADLVGPMQTPPFALLFSLYCALKPGLPVSEWIEENNVWDLNVDVRRFILFGVIHNFIYRIHKYPVWVARDENLPLTIPLPIHSVGASSSASSVPAAATAAAAAAAATPPTPGTPQHQGHTQSRALKRYLDGTRHYDALCTLFGCSAKELDDVIAADAPACVKFIWR
ncbi:Nitrogen permease regulator 2 [Thoreauomyces humboldtii]|nr:Nitrogen permease regulator 2 [Thoreauomyces humboldtii]